RDISHLDVADELSKALGNHPVTGDNDRSYIVFGNFGTHPVLAYVSQGSRSTSGWDANDDENVTNIRVNRIKIEITAHRKAIKDIQSHLNSSFKETEVSSI